MNRINEIDNTIEGKEIKTYDQDHPELVVLSGRLYGKVTYVEYFNAYYLQFGDNVYYFPQKDSYQEGKNWKKKKFDSYEECLNFSQQHNIKIVMKSTVKSPFSNGLPDTRFLFPKRNTPYDPSEMADVSRIRENKHNTNMNKNLIRLTENDLHNIVKESVNKVLTELDWKTKMNYVMGRQKQCDEAYRQGDENGARKYWDKADDGIYDVRDEFEKKYNGRPFRNMKDDKFRMGDINKNTGDIYTSFNHGKCFNNYTSKNGNAPDVYGYDNDYYLDNFEDKNDVDTFRRMNKDVNNYRNGNSKYVKGKGWQ